MAEYVLVVRGVEILRTTNEDEVKEMMGKSSDEWYVYYQGCNDCSVKEILITDTII